MLFSQAMIRALLAGRKMQTRRLTGIADTSKIVDFVKVATDKRGRSVYEMKDRHGSFVSIPAGKNFVTPHYSPRIGIGDRVYVREAWRVSQKWDETAPRDLPKQKMTVFCEAGGSIANQKSGKWEPDFDYPPFRPDWVGKFRQAMHQPRWASRLTLIVTDVRVERLNSISREDAVAEGLIRIPTAPRQAVEMGCDWGFEGDGRHGSPVSAYAALWNHINGPDAWAANPLVVAYSFRAVMGNIDLIEKAAA
jgi:hypothetical protein